MRFLGEVLREIPVLRVLLLVKVPVKTEWPKTRWRTLAQIVFARLSAQRM
jgi:hypothetical protein